MPSTLSAKLAYPVARKDESVAEDFHGTQIKDVYRWLEDPDSTETEEFVNAQNSISRPFLENGEEWKKLNTKLTKLWNYPKYGCPMRYGNYYYYFMNTGLQNQSVMYQQKSLGDESESKVFLDPNTLSEDGTIALTQKAFSEDGKYMAYGLSESGSDWIKILIRDAETGKDLSEVLEKVKFSEISWTKDNKGFFYGVSTGLFRPGNSNSSRLFLRDTLTKMEKPMDLRPNRMRIKSCTITGWVRARIKTHWWSNFRKSLRGACNDLKLYGVET